MMKIVLDSFGTALIKKDNTLVIKNIDGTFNVDPQKVDTIIISKGAIVSSDAIIFAIENQIDIIFTDKKGNVKARVWSPNIVAITQIRRNQLEFSFSPEAVEWIKQILQEKINNQIAVLLAFYPDEESELTEQINQTINKLKDYRGKIKSTKGDFITEVAPKLRGWEGAATRAYFATIAKILPEKYKTQGRTKHPAKDVFNAMLNYAYGILYGKIESALIRAGIDPYIGVMHREDYGRPVLTFDVIEKFRHWADYVIITLLLQEVISDDCYEIDENGAYWLQGVGKRIVIQSMYDYLDEEIKINNSKKSRNQIINDYAYELAKMFLQYKPKNL